MRPALEGHAGIPQEVRLLFHGLTSLEGIAVEGLLQSSNRIIARGLPHPDSAAYRRLKIDQRIHRLSRVVVSLRASQHPRLAERLADALRLLVAPAGIVARALVGREHKLGTFEGEHFQDFVWREMFARTLPVAIYGYLGFFGREWGPLTAAAMVSVVPVIAVFALFQRYFLSGMSGGGVKG